MSSDAQFDDFGGDSEAPRPVKKKGLSTGAVVAIVLGIVFGVLLLLCCGVIGYFAMKLRPITDPTQIAAVQSGMVSSMELPEKFQASFAMDTSFGAVPIKLVAYSTVPGMQPDQSHLLMLMQLPGGADPDQVAGQMGQQNVGQQDPVVAESTETKKVTIDGVERTVTIIKGKQQRSQTEVRQVATAFEGKGGTVILTLVVPETEWDEERIVRFLESIKK